MPVARSGPSFVKEDTLFDQRVLQGSVPVVVFFVFIGFLLLAIHWVNNLVWAPSETKEELVKGVKPRYDSITEEGDDQKGIPSTL